MYIHIHMYICKSTYLNFVLLLQNWQRQQNERFKQQLTQLRQLQQLRLSRLRQEDFSSRQKQMEITTFPAVLKSKHQCKKLVTESY